jgi:hypothetical protein
MMDYIGLDWVGNGLINDGLYWIGLGRERMN